MKHIYAHNPLLDDDVFVPDVEAHVWGDGRIYLYGSFDICGKASYCSGEYHVYSSSDMVEWTDHGVVFSLKDSIWAKDCAALYAPDCAYRNGIYYLYYCVPDGRCGVASSPKPAGPFKDLGQLEGIDGIDPAVFIDDDGQAYIYWGQLNHGRCAKLKENMIQIDPESVSPSLNIPEHEFHEGSSVKKINGKYYFLFADTHRHNNRPTCLGYAVSDSPMTGFRYGGVVIDNFNCDPGVWNNHGSIECFKGQWYVFYHRSTHGTEFSRRVCAEPITIGDDGTISQAVQTSSGVGGAIFASEACKASYACELYGDLRICSDMSGNIVLGKISDSDTALYRYLNFRGENTFSIKLKADTDCRLELYIDELYHTELRILKTSEMTVVTETFTPIFGCHSLMLKFYGAVDAAADEFTFTYQNK